MNPTPKTITVPLKLFIEYTLHGRDRIAIDENIAIIIANLDKEEHLCHVEFYPSEKDRLPILWSIQDWRVDIAKVRRDKLHDAREKHLNEELLDNTKTLQDVLCKITSCEPSYMYIIARNMILKNKLKEITALGVKLKHTEFDEQRTIKELRLQ
jgi:hypothetical protein